MSHSPSVPSGPRRGALMGVLLGVSMGLANVLSYLFVVVLSRSLGPEDFGGYSAMSTYGILLTIPAGAFQVVVARHLASGVRTSGVRLALAIGMTLAAGTALVSPLLAGAFHLPSAWAAALLGLTLVPMTATGAFQGVLLGRHRLHGLSVLYIVTAGGRLVAAVVAAVLGLGVTQVFGLLLLASAVAAGWGWWSCRDLLPDLPGTAPGLAGELLRSNTTLAAFMALTNVDVLLARHFLNPHDSGGYALASTFGRAVCWATQFLALLIVPRMQRAHASRALLRASGLVLGLGLAVLALVSAAPTFWIRLAGGQEYVDFAHLAVACVALGICWALAQVWLFSEMGGSSGVLGALTWVVLAVQVAVISLWLHGSAAQILTVCGIGALIIAVTGLVRVLLGGTPEPMDESSAIAATDGPRA